MEKCENMFYQEYKLILGNYLLNAGVTIECASSSNSSSDYLKIKLTDELKKSINVKKDDFVSLGIQNKEIFTGYITDISSDYIICKDALVKFNEIKINNVFKNVTPQDIIKHCLNLLKINDYQISDIYFSSKNLIIKNQSILDVLKLISSQWKINVNYYMLNKKFYWGIDEIAQDIVYQFEYGLNIISLDNDFGTIKLASSAFPSITHSQNINVIHPKLTGNFKVNKVIYKVSEKGFIRTELFFKEVN